MNGLFTAMLGKCAELARKVPGWTVLVVLAVLIMVAVAIAISAPGHMVPLASGQAWTK